jgi:hypothetical protein
MAENPLARTERTQNADIRFPTSNRVYQQVIKYVQPNECQYIEQPSIRQMQQTREKSRFKYSQESSA